VRRRPGTHFCRRILGEHDEAEADTEPAFGIGTYPAAHLATTQPYPKMYPLKYVIPDAFYKVTERSARLPVSPHFKLGDFDLHYEYLNFSLPHYIALKTSLLEKLEILLDMMNEDGFGLSTFTIISGFRSPYYNRGSIYNGADLKTPYSRHQYGDAVDMLVDINPKDDIMDDLNKDGNIDINDARVIMRYANRLDNKLLKEESPLLGGAAVYTYHDIPERIQSPYIHVDTRGFPNVSGSPVRWEILEKQN